MADDRDGIAYLDQQKKNFSKIPEDNEPDQTEEEIVELRRTLL